MRPQINFFYRSGLKLFGPKLAFKIYLYCRKRRPNVGKGLKIVRTSGSHSILDTRPYFPDRENNTNRQATDHPNEV